MDPAIRNRILIPQYSGISIKLNFRKTQVSPQQRLIKMNRRSVFFFMIKLSVNIDKRFMYYYNLICNLMYMRYVIITINLTIYNL